MEENIIEIAMRLNECILESDEYQTFCLYREEISQWPELYATVQEFRRKNFEICVEQDTEERGANAAYRLYQEYRNILENPLAAAYLNAELCICKMLQNVTKNICRDIDIGLDFL